MKLLTGLGETLCDFTGKPIRVTTEIDECPKCGHRAEKANTWTVADVLLHILGQSRAQGKDAYALHDVGKIIYQAEGADVRLEDHPFGLLKEEVRTFGGFTMLIMVPVRRVLDLAESTTEFEIGSVPLRGENVRITRKEEVCDVRANSAP